MDPLKPDAQNGPQGTIENGSFRYRYRKDAPDVLVEVQESATLADGSWTPTAWPEQSDGADRFWRDFPMSGERLFVRLRVEPVD